MHKCNYKCLHVGIEGLGKQKVMLYSLTAYILLKREFRQQEGNSLIVSMTSLEMEDRKEGKHGL